MVEESRLRSRRVPDATVWLVLAQEFRWPLKLVDNNLEKIF